MAVPSPIPNLPWNILIIDDDEDDFIIARSMLKEAKGRKFAIDWADTYPAGKEKLFSDHYHAVLVDYDLGTRSGIDLIREAAVNEGPYRFGSALSYPPPIEVYAAHTGLCRKRYEIGAGHLADVPPP